MRAELFQNSPSGSLVPISGTDPRFGPWQHVAFVPLPLERVTPPLSATTFNAVARARAALASLDSSAKRLPNPALLRRSSLSREAQSTSALEGTYAPLQEVLAADEDEDQSDEELREVLNYLRAAEHAFAWVGEGRPLTLGLLIELQARLVRGTTAETVSSGRVRDIQVVIGARRGARVQDARFIPRPPGPELEAQVRDWLDWVGADHGNEIDPVVAAAMGHYQFETLHPFNDGNGRIGRLFIVLQLLHEGVLTEPTLTVSPWFEARRADYFDRLLGVSSAGNWNDWVRFFADGLTASAVETAAQLEDLLSVQADLKDRVKAAGLRADTAISLVDFALARPIFTVRQVERRLGVTYARANGLVAQLVEAGVLAPHDEARYNRTFSAPDVLAVLLR
ncbi:Fic family protein [Geodermatophilaceae bacterium NBWT11]|nr:Fic family protein [Geodermatophilaceae bacterium NBWT11]